MNTEELVAIHHDIGLELMRGPDARQIGPDCRANDLLLAARHMLCAWVLCEATESQVLDIIDRNRTSHNN